MGSSKTALIDEGQLGFATDLTCKWALLISPPFLSAIPSILLKSVGIKYRDESQ